MLAKHAERLKRLLRRNNVKKYTFLQGAHAWPLASNTSNPEMFTNLHCLCLAILVEYDAATTQPPVTMVVAEDGFALGKIEHTFGNILVGRPLFIPAKLLRHFGNRKGTLLSTSTSNSRIIT
jgi:hypothetical protein